MKIQRLWISLFLVVSVSLVGAIYFIRQNQNRIDSAPALALKLHAEGVENSELKSFLLVLDLYSSEDLSITDSDLQGDVFLENVRDDQLLRYESAESILESDKLQKGDNRLLEVTCSFYRSKSGELFLRIENFGEFTVSDSNIHLRAFTSYPFYNWFLKSDHTLSSNLILISTAQAERAAEGVTIYDKIP